MTTLFAAAMLTTEGWQESVRLTIADGFIRSVDCGVEAEAGDQRHAVILPALDNLHSHAFQRGMAGLAETRSASHDDFWSWRDTMYRFASRTSPEQLEAIAAQAYVEMLEAGYTRVGEFHYLHRDVDGTAYADPGEMSARIAAAAECSGIGLTLLPVFYAHASFGGLPPRANQARFIHDPDSYARLLERCRSIVASLPGGRVGVAPHSLRAVTPKELHSVVALAGDAPIHIHIAEQTHEVDECLAWSGARPVQWLLDHAPVDSRWCLVHATHVDSAETQGIAASRAIAGLCPVTEANLGDGIFPAAAFAAADGRWGIGTDSNVAIDLVAELSLLEYAQRLSRRVRTVLVDPGRSNGRSLFERALTGGGAALGDPGRGIAVGAVADLLSLDVQRPSLLRRRGDALLDSWLFASPRGAIDCVWARGRKQVAGGRHVRADAVKGSYRQAMEELCQ